VLFVKLVQDAAYVCECASSMVRLFCKLRRGGAADRYTYTKSPSLEEQEVQPPPPPRQTFSMLPLRNNANFLQSHVGRKSSSKKNKKKGANHLQQDKKCQASNIDEVEIADLPSVPTAIGYQSSLSEDEWLEEQSRSSRYATWDDEELMVLASGQQQDEEEGDVDRYTTLVVMDSSIETSPSSPLLQDSFESVEQEIGNQLQRERERLKATIVENNTAGPQAAGISFDLCFGTNATTAVEAVVASNSD